MSRSWRGLVIPFSLTSLFLLTRPTGALDAGSLPQSTLIEWCQAQSNTCMVLCNGGTQENSCSLSTLDFNCICSDGTSPDVGAYAESIPSLECEFTKSNCVSANPNNLAAQESCTSASTCGTLVATASGTGTGTGAVASSTTSTAAGSSTTTGTTTSTAGSDSTTTGGSSATTGSSTQAAQSRSSDASPSSPSAKSGETSPDPASASQTSSKSNSTGTGTGSGSGNGNGGGGLSTSAIAGIAVGCSIIVIGGAVALAWYIFRLRYKLKLAELVTPGAAGKSEHQAEAADLDNDRRAQAELDARENAVYPQLEAIERPRAELGSP